MKFSEFLQDSDVDALITIPYRLKFPKLTAYLFRKYANFEILYDKMTMISQLGAVFDEYENMLTNIEDAFKIRKQQANDLSTLGETNKRLKNTKYTSEGVDTTNYVGYEVVGEFEKKNDTLVTNNDVDDKSNTYNFLSALTRLETEGNRLGWFKFERAFVRLFITIYPIVW